jgi:DNA-directed RNA polymerase II subunit RPB2
MIQGGNALGSLVVTEMERDALLAHSTSRFLKEKLVDNADAYSTFVCDECGLFAQRLYKKDNQSYITNKDIYYCPACMNYTKISKVMIPYAFKLLIHEMMAMNIAPRIRVKK